MENLFFVSIQEDVVFPDGENVEELLSISLDPQVTMEAKKEGTTLAGTIEVTGEYSIITDEDENIRQFFRHIPVHAFIPPDRQAAEDADIQIHSFDYDVQKPSRLVLTAELALAVTFAQEEKPAFDEVELNSNEEQEEQEEQEESVAEASVQVQKGTAEETSIFSWLDEKSEYQAEWRFSIQSSGDVSLKATQDEEQPQEE